MPRISVVLPTYNRARVLRRAIDSVLNQTFQDLELIVVDDGSTDGTNAILKSYSDRIRVVVLNNNVGPCRARNVGIQASSGELVAFQDSDDEWLPNKLEVQVNRMDSMVVSMHRPLGASYTRIAVKITEEIDRYVPPHGYPEQLKGNLYSQLLKANLVGTPTLLVRRQVLDDIGMFDESLSQLEDWDLALRIALKYDFDFVDEPLIISHFSPDGVNSRRDSTALYRILLKHSDEYLLHFREVGSGAFWTAGDELMKSGHTAMGKKALWMAIRLSPKRHTVLAWLGSYLGSKAYKSLSALFGYSTRGSTARIE